MHFVQGTKEEVLFQVGDEPMIQCSSNFRDIFENISSSNSHLYFVQGTKKEGLNQLDDDPMIQSSEKFCAQKSK